MGKHFNFYFIIRLVSFKMIFQLFALTILAASAMCTSFDQCDSGAPIPLELRVVGCEEPPCDFVRGKNVSAEVDFEAGNAINHMRPQSIVQILGGVVEYPLPEPDACKSLLNAVCPLEEGDRASYQLTLPVLEIYPTVPLITEISLIDTDTGTTIVCFKISGQVV